MTNNVNVTNQRLSERGEGVGTKYFLRLMKIVCHTKIFLIQVSFAICRGYVPEKSQTTNTKTDIFGLFLAKIRGFSSFFCGFCDR